jgi:homogentisate 1,2-dioxygenase
VLERMVVGRVPAKHHIVLRDERGELLWEECFTRDGFEGPYTISYHQHRPHEHQVAQVEHGWPAARAAAADAARPISKRHYRSQELAHKGGAPVDCRVPLLFNDDVVVSVAYPDAADPTYVANVDGDELVYVHQGGGTVRSVLGDLRFGQGDYVCLPRGLPYRLVPDAAAGAQYWLSMELAGGVDLLKQWRNDHGQLRMDAPYCHRDFRRTEFVGPVDEGLRKLHVKRGGRWSAFTLPHSPLDVVGWDGSVYPWAFPILAFQPRAGLVHLPPTWHGTFGARGVLVCSFVPRVVDFHPEAIPCPYPHSSPSCDEILFYCAGNFTSRKGVGPGSISHHPTGIPHGPHPGSYEASIGAKTTNELAVMLDTYKPLVPTDAALGVEDPAYHDSFRTGA